METWEVLRALAERHHGLIPEVYSRDLSARDLHYFLRYGVPGRGRRVDAFGYMFSLPKAKAGFMMCR
jgi:hypothetical protein